MKETIKPNTQHKVHLRAGCAWCDNSEFSDPGNGDKEHRLAFSNQLIDKGWEIIPTPQKLRDTYAGLRNAKAFDVFVFCPECAAKEPPHLRQAYDGVWVDLRNGLTEAAMRQTLVETPGQGMKVICNRTAKREV